MEPQVEGGTDLTADVDLSVRVTPPDLHDPAQRADVERTLRTIPGVLSARVVPGYERPVDELHVVTTVAKTPKQGVRDVQTVLMARYGLSMDHRVISVAQLDEDDHSLAPRDRVVIDRVALSHVGTRVQIEVVLRTGDQTWSGQAEGGGGARGRHRATAQATLDAAAAMLDPAYTVDLVGATVTDLLGHPVAVSLLHLHAGRYGTTLSGSAPVRDAEVEAVARCVLDALNRVLEESAD